MARSKRIPHSRLAVITLTIGLLTTSFGLLEGFAQDEPDRVWIYRKQAMTGDQSRSIVETYFTPFFYFPQSATSRIRVNPSKPVAGLGPDETPDDTCVEVLFGLQGGEDFCGAGFIPGDKLGDKPALDLTKYLAVGSGRQVHLKFRARTADRESVRVRFESCGLSAGSLEDGVKLPQTPRPEITPLTDRWSPISIDLSRRATGLSSLVCPLKVVAKSNENPGKDEVTVFIDDIRFEIIAPTKKEK